jgi:FKBP-type peptidyl-prolyl cis-trans isomerase FklB
MRLWVAMLGLVVVVGLAAAQEKDEKPAKSAPKVKQKADDKDSVELELSTEPNPLGKKAGDTKEIVGKVSYGMGLQIGRNLKQGGLNPDLKRFMKGVQDALEDNESELTEEEITAAFRAFEPIARKVAADRAKSQSDKNVKSGDAFLEANKQKEGVKTLPSGLQYKVLAVGKGRSPKATDTVRVHYRGKLIDGKVFDQTYTGETPTKRDEPGEFKVNGVIRGWTEGLQKMKVGDKWQLIIPSELAYKEAGAGGVIGPNAVLIFDVELLEILE